MLWPGNSGKILISTGNLYLISDIDMIISGKVLDKLSKADEKPELIRSFACKYSNWFKYDGWNKKYKSGN